MLKVNLRLLILGLLAALMLACQTAPGPSLQHVTKQQSSDAQTLIPEKDDARSLYQRAIEYARNEQVDSAIEQFQQLIAHYPAFDQAYTNLGLLWLQKKQLTQAKNAFESAIYRDKSDAIAYNHLAIIQREQGLFKQALVNYRKAIELKSEYANAYLNLGILLDIYIQDLPEALKQYRIYQKITDNKNNNVEKWVVDLERRLKSQHNNQKG